MPAEFLDVDRLFEVFARYEIEYIIVGGVAGVLAGSPIVTQDLDVVCNPSAENNLRLLEALKEIRAYYWDPAGRHIEPNLRKVETFKMHLLVTDFGRLDILRSIGAGLTYRDLLSRSYEYDVEGIRLRAIDLETLIETKEHANRPKDQYALPFLRQLLEMKTSRDSAQDERRNIR